MPRVVRLEKLTLPTMNLILQAAKSSYMAEIQFFTMPDFLLVLLIYFPSLSLLNVVLC